MASSIRNSLGVISRTLKYASASYQGEALIIELTDKPWGRGDGDLWY